MTPNAHPTNARERLLSYATDDEPSRSILLLIADAIEAAAVAAERAGIVKYIRALRDDCRTSGMADTVTVLDNLLVLLGEPQ